MNQVPHLNFKIRESEIIDGWKYEFVIEEIYQGKKNYTNILLYELDKNLRSEEIEELIDDIVNELNVTIVNSNSENIIQLNEEDGTYFLKYRFVYGYEYDLSADTMIYQKCNFCNYKKILCNLDIKHNLINALKSYGKNE